LVLACKHPGPPFALAGAAPFGVASDADWYLWLGHGDALQRAVFIVFAPGAVEPSWIVKLGRVPGYTDSFLRDEAGLAVVPARGTVAAHAPTFLGRATVAGHAISVETAAIGRPLTDVLLGRSESAALEMVTAVTDWLVQLASATRVAGVHLSTEVARIRDDVLPAWAAVLEPAEASALVDALDGVPAVAQHNDVGSWNVLSRPPEFTVVDWESARARGLPIWDVLYFLADAFAHVDRALSGTERADHALALFRGDSRWSPRVFAAVRRCVAALSVPPESVGAIATLCWMHHGTSGRRRSDALGRPGGSDGEAAQHIAEIARGWLEDPQLGASWRAWR
jgi:hypothetical protein